MRAMIKSGKTTYRNYSFFKFDFCIAYESFFKISLMWFTMYGYGIFIKNIKHHTLLFSERSGFYYQYQIGNWYFRILGLLKK